jgi:RTX calcium-binding nonapeptide repeat (4 copies)
VRWLITAVGGLAAVFALAVAQNGGSHVTRPAATRPAAPTEPAAPAAPRLDASLLPVWKTTGFVHMPKTYYQGVTSDPHGNFYFDGVFSGLYRTDAHLRETARNADVIPPGVRSGAGYNHIGDISWDAHEGGRLLLPLDCFHPKVKNANTCGTGAIGVADPRTLKWRYYVKLDPADIKKATWNEISPDGKLIWTSSARALIAYRAADVNPANAGRSGHAIRPVRRIPHAVPPSGITGATFYDGRLFIAGSNRGHGGPFQVWSISTVDGSRLLEIERPIVGESEGLDVAPALGGLLHWQIMPFNPAHERPTYGEGHATLLQFLLDGACANIDAVTAARRALTCTAAGDKLLGGSGRDRLDGAGGGDCLFGGSGSDTLRGGAGDDRLVGGPGRDILLGGPGRDVVIAADGTRDVVDCGPGLDVAVADREDRVVGCEKTVIR